MSPEEIVKNLTYLMDRQAIYDAIANYSRLVDRLDRDVLDKVYHEDAIDDHVTFVGNPEGFFDWVKALHSTGQHSTQHNIGTHLCEIDGDAAHTESYFTYGGMNMEGAPFSLIGGRYFDRLEKRDGKWGIVARKFVVDWAAPSINSREKYLTPEGATNFGMVMQPYEQKISESAVKSARDHTDPSYERPLTVPEARHREYTELKRAAENESAEA